MSKNVLITGATGNLGSAVSNHFIGLGYQVIGTMRPGSTPPKSKVDFYECDLTDEEATKTFFDKVKKNYTTIDAAVFLIGGFGMGNIENASSTDMMRMFSLNYMTAFHSTQNTFKWMAEGKGGRIILVGAKPAFESGATEVLPYAVSKNAVAKLAEILNESGADKNIQTSVIVPSVIDTPPNQESMPDADFNDWVTPEEIAESIGFLVSDKASPLRDTVLKLYKNA